MPAGILADRGSDTIRTCSHNGGRRCWESLCTHQYLNVVIFVIGGMLTTLCLKWVHENTNFHISVKRNKINIKIGKYFQHSVNISI